ncbi:Potassium voltage-gated channel sub C member 4, partial [Phlyctochytrium bullatum]
MEVPDASIIMVGEEEAEEQQQQSSRWVPGTSGSSPPSRPLPRAGYIPLPRRTNSALHPSDLSSGPLTSGTSPSRSFFRQKPERKSSTMSVPSRLHVPTRPADLTGSWLDGPGRMSPTDIEPPKDAFLIASTPHTNHTQLTGPPASGTWLDAGGLTKDPDSVTLRSRLSRLSATSLRPPSARSAQKASQGSPRLAELRVSRDGRASVPGSGGAADPAAYKDRFGDEFDFAGGARGTRTAFFALDEAEVKELANGAGYFQSPFDVPDIPTSIESDEEAELPNRPGWIVQLSTVMNDRKGSRAGRVVNAFFLYVLLLSIATFCLGTMQFFAYNPVSRTVLFVVDSCCIVVFTLEFILRVIVVETWSGLLNPLLIIDLVSVIPYYVEVAIVVRQGTDVVTGLTAIDGVSALRVLRLVRTFRILKFIRKSTKLAIILQAVRSSVDGIAVLFVTVGILVVFYSALLYYAEQAIMTLNDDRLWVYRDGSVSPYQSIPECFYYLVGSLTGKTIRAFTQAQKQKRERRERERAERQAEIEARMRTEIERERAEAAREEAAAAGGPFGTATFWKSRFGGRRKEVAEVVPSSPMAGNEIDDDGVAKGGDVGRMAMKEGCERVEDKLTQEKGGDMKSSSISTLQVSPPAVEVLTIVETAPVTVSRLPTVPFLADEAVNAKADEAGEPESEAKNAAGPAKNAKSAYELVIASVKARGSQPSKGSSGTERQPPGVVSPPPTAPASPKTPMTPSKSGSGIQTAKHGGSKSSAAGGAVAVHAVTSFKKPLKKGRASTVSGKAGSPSTASGTAPGKPMSPAGNAPGLTTSTSLPSTVGKTTPAGSTGPTLARTTGQNVNVPELFATVALLLAPGRAAPKDVELRILDWSYVRPAPPSAPVKKTENDEDGDDSSDEEDEDMSDEESDGDGDGSDENDSDAIVGSKGRFKGLKGVVVAIPSKETKTVKKVERKNTDAGASARASPSEGPSRVGSSATISTASSLPRQLMEPQPLVVPLDAPDRLTMRIIIRDAEHFQRIMRALAE